MSVPKIDSTCSLRWNALGLLAAMLVVPAMAQDTQPSPVNHDDANARAENESLEAIAIIGGMSGAQNERWAETDAAKPLLPVVPEDAFLEAESVESPETRGER